MVLCHRGLGLEEDTVEQKLPRQRLQQRQQDADCVSPPESTVFKSFHSGSVPARLFLAACLF